MAMRLIVPDTKYATERPSGENTGLEGPNTDSVPSMGRDSYSFSARGPTGGSLQTR